LNFIPNFLRKKSIPKTVGSQKSLYSGDSLSSLFGSISDSSSLSYTAAMRQQDVYACIRIKSESIGQLPVRLFSQDGVDKTEILSGVQYNVFTQRPNSYQTWQDFIETYVTSLETVGNFYAEIKRNRYNNVYEIVPFKHQTSCNAQMNSLGQIYYTYATNDGKGKVTTQTYQANDILHIKLNSQNGYVGLSPITQSSQMLTTAIAGDTHASSLFENGARPAGVLSTDQSFGEDEEAEASIARLKDQWDELYKGPKNSGKTAVLEFGMKYQQIQMSAVDTQLIEQRKYSREQICAIFRVPIHMLGSPDGMKYNTVEQTATAFFRDSLMPLVTRLENNIKLLLPSNHSIKLDEREFTRGDRKTQVATLKEEMAIGVASLNDANRELGRRIVEGGDDIYIIATNNFTYGTWDQQKQLTDAAIEAAKLEAKPPVAPKDNSKGDNIIE
jgi:HK97 family phage portal protein